MKNSTLCLIALIFFTSCLLRELEPTKKEKLEVFHAAKFEADLINDQSQYTALLKTVLENLDSIVNDNRSIHYSKTIDSVFDLIHTEKLVISKEKGNTLIRFDINRYKVSVPAITSCLRF